MVGELPGLVKNNRNQLAPVEMGLAVKKHVIRRCNQVVGFPGEKLRRYKEEGRQLTWKCLDHLTPLLTNPLHKRKEKKRKQGRGAKAR